MREPMSRSAKPRAGGGTDHAGPRVWVRACSEGREGPRPRARVPTRVPGTSRGLSPRTSVRLAKYAGPRPTLWFCTTQGISSVAFVFWRVLRQESSREP